jgi:transposase
MMAHLHGERLTSWITADEQAGLPGMSVRRRAERRPRRCHRRAEPVPFSSGPVEGNVNRIKMIKRQMYGRAASNCFLNGCCSAADSAREESDQKISNWPG